MKPAGGEGSEVNKKGYRPEFSVDSAAVEVGFCWRVVDGPLLAALLGVAELRSAGSRC